MSTECLIELPRLHPKQQMAYDTEATDLLFGGATRGGKSYFVRHALIKWCALIPGLQCDMFRLYCDDIIAETMQGETGFPALLANPVRQGLVKITETEVRFWNGSLISLEHASDPAQVRLKHQGIAKHVRVFIESTQIEASLIKWLTGWVTMSEEMLGRVPKELQGRFPRIIHVTNPIGTSVSYYRREYVEPREPFQIEKVGRWKRQYIPALVEDNPSEDPVATYERVMDIGDEAIATALLKANWNAMIGEFFPEFDENRHVITDFYPPDHWYRFRAFDWGTADPFCVLWFAVSDGEPFRDSDGVERWFPRGALIVYDEWYGADPHDPSRGLRMRNEDMAHGIVERSELNHKNIVTLADSKPFADNGGDSIATIFARNGVILTRADTTRIGGWAQVRDRLIGDVYDSNSTSRIPMIFFCLRCKAVRRYLPALARHPSEAKKEDAQEHGEATHAADTVRYGVMALSRNAVRDKQEPLQSRIDRLVKKNALTINNISVGNAPWRSR